MENRAHAIAAGIFTIALVLGSALAVWWFSGTREITRELLLVTKSSVSGLSSQAQVRFRGIRAGKVEDITIDAKDPSLILVTVSVEEWLPVTTATTAEIKQQGLTGIAFVELSDSGTDGKPLSENRGEVPRIVLHPSTFDMAGDELAAILVQVKELAQRANALLTADNIEHVGNTLVNLEIASGEASKSLRQVPETVAAIRRFASPDNVERMARLMASLDKAGAEATPLVKDARELVSSMQATSKRIDALGGELGGEISGYSLPRLNALLFDLSNNSRQLTRVLNQIENSPQQLLVGRPAGAPGPGETGFAAPH